jgi:RimJ/RimL family protein N-acetyltransferase
MIPTLTTARLTLRAPAMDDFADYAAFLATDRAWGLGGPMGTEKAWAFMTNDVAQWKLLGMGALMLVPHGQTAALGQVAVCHGPLFPEPELGWFLYAGAEGQGYALEAARAMRDWALGPRGLSALVSYIDPRNARSRRLAERLGARHDHAGPTPNNEPTECWRHAPGRMA